MSFDLKDYVDVAARIRELKGEYPASSLQSELTWINGDHPGWLCKAYAFRDPDDIRPGIGHAFEPVPGKTPYTKDSEPMNAETSAWGRAIVALGFETKKIASADEVRARQSSEEGPPQVPSSDATEYLKAAAYAQRPGALPSEQVIHFGKNKGTLLGALEPAQLRWYAESWKVQDDPQPYDVRLKSAAQALHQGRDVADWDVPFE